MLKTLVKRMASIKLKLVPILISNSISLVIQMVTMHFSTLTLILVEEMALEAEDFVVGVSEEEEDATLAEEVFNVKSVIRLVMMPTFVTIGSLCLLSTKDMVILEPLEAILEVDMVLQVALGPLQMSGCKMLVRGISLILHPDLQFLLSLVTLDLLLLKPI